MSRYLRNLLQSDHDLQDIWVEGEVSDLSQPVSGHLYFNLIDANTSLRCVMWRSEVARQRFLPRDGDSVEVHGNISIYEARGNYQLYADTLHLEGTGILYQEFQLLKERLETEGLFDKARKRPVPTWPRRIGIITSPTGAALQDIQNTIHRRFPLVEIILAPTSVQGDDAPHGIIKGILALNKVSRADVIIIARGGGSIEDLWAFNDEFVARAIANSKVPVITGVGHETDFTIADFAADLRAPTPTAAAELATPDQFDLRRNLTKLSRNLATSLKTILRTHRWTLTEKKNRLQQQSPQARLRTDRQRLDDMSYQAKLALNHYLKLHQTRLDGLAHQLNSMNPISILGRGFAIVEKSDQNIVRSVSQVIAGDLLEVRVSDGSFPVEVSEK